MVTVLILILAVGATTGSGWDEETVRFLVRATARISVLLYVVAIAWDDLLSLARSLPVRRPPPNRARFFVGFAASHLFHLFALVALAIWFPDPFLSDVGAVTLIGGGLAYIAIFGIAILFWIGDDSSPDSPLVTVGLLYIWAVFTRAYALRLDDGYGYTLILALLIGAAVVKGAAFRTTQA